MKNTTLKISLLTLFTLLSPVITSTTLAADTATEIITSASATSANDFFAKVNGQIIPIQIDSFSSQETTIVHSKKKGYHPEIENIYTCAESTKISFDVCALTTVFQTKLNIQKKNIFKLYKPALEKYLSTIQENSLRKPQNAKLAMTEDNKLVVTKKEIVGHSIDIEKTLSDIPKYFGKLPANKIVTLPTKTTLPPITSANYTELGLSTKIGSGNSNFRGSPKNRIHNIHTATEKFENILIAPGEIFSFVENLGDVDESTGYKEELVIKDNKTFPEFGGGICQVSTTLFRAAVNTGLEITERRNHAYPVQYYSPQGTDATIYIPKPDLQFKNNTPNYIFLQPSFNGTLLTFDIFGTSDGRQVVTEGPILLKRTDDGGTKYVWWQIVNDENGEQVSKKGFWSFYQNEAKFHGDEEQIHRTKPKDWSNSQWKRYKKEHGL